MELEKEGKSKKRSLKQRIRDTKRLLARDDLPETVRLTKEQVLRLLDQELTGQQHEQRSKKVLKKYRMVRFFEKRKVTRRLKSKLKEVTSCTDEIERSELLAEIHQLKRELNYVAHYPPEQKYIALYPSTDATSDKTLLKRERLMSQITDQVENGTLPDVTENIPYPHHPSKQIGPMQSKGTDSLIEPTPDKSTDAARTSEEVLHCSLGKRVTGDGTNRRGRDYQSTAPVTDDGTNRRGRDYQSTAPVTGDGTNRRGRDYQSTAPVTGDGTNRRGRDYQSTAPVKAVKRCLVAVDEEPDSESELYQNSWKRLKDDDFFLHDEEKD